MSKCNRPKNLITEKFNSECQHYENGECYLIGSCKWVLNQPQNVYEAPSSAERSVYPLLCEVADDETAREPIQEALFSTGKFTTEQCDNLADGILLFLKDYKLKIVKTS